MKLGEKIFELRKDKKLSQEQLAEKINVTRQTISNWELGETSPNPEQLKLLSKNLEVSIDELLDNDTKEIVLKKISNTEMLAGIIIKILKIFGILFAILFIAVIFLIITFSVIRKGNAKESNINQITTSCIIRDNYYEVTVASDGHYNCSNCDKILSDELKKIYDFQDLEKTEKNIEKYFVSHNGTCQ